MSRLGDLIKLERTRQKLTPKQVAKKCGVSEKYLLDVEAGTRIIQDDQARRILKTIGVREQTEADFSLDEIAATVDLETIKIGERVNAPTSQQPTSNVRKVASSAEDPKEATSGIWLDALAGVLKAVPVMNAAWIATDRKMLPIMGGKIEGASADKVFYFLAPDDSMRGLRILRDDLVLCVPAQSPIDGSIMLCEFGAHRALRKIKILDTTRILLQSYGREYDGDTYSVSDVKFVGRAVRLEAPL